MFNVVLSCDVALFFAEDQLVYHSFSSDQDQVAATYVAASRAFSAGRLLPLLFGYSPAAKLHFTVVTIVAI